MSLYPAGTCRWTGSDPAVGTVTADFSTTPAYLSVGGCTNALLVGQSCSPLFFTWKVDASHCPTLATAKFLQFIVSR
jgi:hypothetical protein